MPCRSMPHHSFPTDTLSSTPLRAATHSSACDRRTVSVANVKNSRTNGDKHTKNLNHRRDGMHEQADLVELGPIHHTTRNSFVDKSRDRNLQTRSISARWLSKDAHAPDNLHGEANHIDRPGGHTRVFPSRGAELATSCSFVLVEKNSRDVVCFDD